MKKNELVAILKNQGYKVEESVNAYGEDKISIKSDDAAVVGVVLQGNKLKSFLDSYENEEDVLKFTSVMFNTDQFQSIKKFTADLKDPEYVKKNIIPCIRKKGVKDDAVVFPVREHLLTYDDLEVYFRIRSNEKDATTIIKKGMIEFLGINTDNLIDLAEDNIKDDYSVKSMLDHLRELHALPEEMIAGMDECPMVVITTSDMNYGAYAINVPEILDRACLKMNSDTIMVIPSSINEIICIPYDLRMNENEVTDMICSVNDTTVMPSQRLSDHPYIYDMSDHNIFPTDVPEIPDPVEYEDLPF